MPTTLIFGGSGKVAQHLTKLLVAAKPPHKVYSVIRNPDQASDIKSLGGEPVIQSIEESSVDDFVATLKQYKPDAVVWSAGAGGKGDPSRTLAVDRDGQIKAQEAVAKAGIKRFVVVSARDVRDRKNKPRPSWYTDDDEKYSDKAWGAIGRYFQAKFEADRDLVSKNSERKLDYTIVRPGSLGTNSATGKVTVGNLKLDGTQINREDVAEVIVEVLNNDKTIGLAFDVVGGETPTGEAVKRVGDERIDNFEGYY